MQGDDLLAEFQRRITHQRGTKTISDSALAKHLGVTQSQLKNYRGKNLTAKQVVNLVEKYSKRAEAELVNEAVRPIVEFLHIDPVQTKGGAGYEILNWQCDGIAHPYFSGIKAQLEGTHGIYIFHDSRGKAIYAGKAQRLSLWKEMNNAFNRDRKEVQNIKRVVHPSSKVQYKSPEEKRRQIRKISVPLHDIASYFSAYSVPDNMISKFEALIIRAFANDLLNVRMENF